MDAIPTLDFAAFRTGDAAARAAVAQQIGAAFERYGFIQLTGHGVPQSALEGAFAAAEAFFDRPEDFKRLVQDRRNNRGYIPMFDTALPGQKPGGHEAFSVGHLTRPGDPALRELPFHAETPWPEMPGFRERIEGCYAAMFALSQDILAAVALHLEVVEDFFVEASRESYSNMRVVHYPPAEAIAEVTDIGVRAHADEGLITLLIQDMNGGLFVQGPAGDWLPVVPNREAMVINVGKLLRRWTNGRYQAAMHKVVNTSGRERYSIPLFVHPSYHTRIDPESLVGQAPAGPDFAPIVAGEQVYANFKARRVSWQEAAKA
ncbi:isopenicillin N synthase family dioxygenase [Roseomonas sp. F4]